MRSCLTSSSCPPTSWGSPGAATGARCASPRWLANHGTGPLQIDPIPDEVCAPNQRYVEQRVFVHADGDGTFDRRRDLGTVALPGGCTVFHPRHEHCHFDSSAGYALTAVENDEPILATETVSFCLRDSEPLRSATARQVRSYEDCARTTAC